MLRNIKRLTASGIALLSIVVLVLLAPFFDSSFSLHMLFHVILMFVLAPALLLGQFFLWALPKSYKLKLMQALNKVKPILSFLTYPLIAIILSTGVLWLGHIPLFYDASLQNEPLHVDIHISFLIVYLFYWSSLINSPLQLPQLTTNESKTLYIAIGAMQGMILSALIMFSNQVIYPFYLGVSHLGGFSALADQQLGGGIMLLAGSIAYILAAILSLKNDY